MGFSVAGGIDELRTSGFGSSIHKRDLAGVKVLPFAIVRCVLVTWRRAGVSELGSCWVLCCQLCSYSYLALFE